ncbi:hypothetical protein AB0M20_12605 [Actinoplanes sp. NPDC051633]|uniref:hypothetical protein n=1 Tax=Actinoplanes sp. NPDC051633 TaxID=3155670 RepID=UPI003419DFDC
MNMREEMAGAWRSLRYDMGKRDEHQPEPSFPEEDLTSTGMSTFGGAADMSGGIVERSEHVRPPRRVAAVAAFGALAVTGAVGSYFAVVNGLGALLSEEPAAPDPYPLAVDGPDGAMDDTLAANAGMGRGTTARPPAGTTDPAAAGAVGAVGVPPVKLTQPAPRRTAAPGTRPAQPGGTPPNEDCNCLTPPVPTPTAPGTSVSPSTSASPSASASASASSEPPSSSPTAEPSASGSGEPDGRSAKRRHHRQ